MLLIFGEVVRCDPRVTRGGSVSPVLTLQLLQKHVHLLDSNTESSGKFLFHVLDGFAEVFAKFLGSVLGSFQGGDGSTHGWFDCNQ